MLILSPALLIASASTMATPRSNGATLTPRHRDSAVNMRYLNHVGFWSHFDQRSGVSSWPLPPCSDPDLWASYGIEAGILRDAPRMGDIYLLHDPEFGRFVRAGIVAEVVSAGMPADPDATAKVLGLDGVKSAEINGRVAAFVQTLSRRRGDRYLRWVNLDPRAKLGNPTKRGEPRRECVA